MMLTAAGSLDNFLQFLGALLVFIGVLAVTYFVTRWIGNYQKLQLKNKNMQVIETMRISNNKYIQIVKVAEEYLVIGISKDGMQLLSKLDEKSIGAMIMPEETEQESFQDILKKMKARKK